MDLIKNTRPANKEKVFMCFYFKTPELELVTSVHLQSRVKQTVLCFDNEMWYDGSP